MLGFPPDAAVTSEMPAPQISKAVKNPAPHPCRTGIFESGASWIDAMISDGCGKAVTLVTQDRNA